MVFLCGLCRRALTLHLSPHSILVFLKPSARREVLFATRKVYLEGDIACLQGLIKEILGSEQSMDY